MIGRIVAHYEITEKLGSGGMGVVYKAFDSKLRRHVALKFMPLELSADAEAKDRFIQEARAAAALDHSSICTVHEIGETGDSPEYGESQLFIAMAFYEGNTLDHRIKQGPVPRDESLRIATRIAEGLARAHAEGIVHRDIKPGNIMLTDDGEVKILDFGIAKLAGQTKLTRMGSTLGTAAYMSPEQARGETVDGRSDLWSLGVILYQMLSGRAPFQGEFEQAIIYAILNQEPAPLKGESGSVRNVVTRLMAKPLDDRYADCGEVLDDLKRLHAGKSVRAQRRLPRGIIGLAMAVVALLVGYLWLVDPGEQSHVSPADEILGPVDGDTGRIAILPFTYHGTKDKEWLGDGLMNLMVTNLGGTRAGNTVSGSTVQFAINQLDSTRTRFDGDSVARFLNVTRYVQGEVVAVGDQLRISAELHDRNAPGNEPLRGNVAGTFDDLYRLVDELGGQLLVGLTFRLDQREATLALDDVNLEALKAFLTGMQLERMDDRRGTIEAFMQAVAEDSTFSLAWYRLSLNQSSPSDNRDAILRAIELSGDLPERDQQMMAGRLAELDGQYDDAEQIYRTIIRDDPQDVYALVSLVDLLWAYAAPRGSPQFEAMPYARRVVELAPDFRNWMRFYLTYYAIETGDVEYLAANNPCEKPFVNLCPLSKLVQAYDHDPAGAFALLDEPHWGGNEDAGEWWILKEFDRLRTVPDVSLDMGRRMVAPSCDLGVRRTGRLQLAMLFTARGQFRAAKAHLDSLNAMDDVFGDEYPGCIPAFALEMLAYCATMPFTDLEPGAVDSLRRTLEIWNADSVADFGPWPTNNGRHDVIRLYLLGLLDIRRLDIARASLRAEELEGLAATSRDESATLDLASSIRARVAYAQGDAEEALALLEDLPRKFAYWRSYSIYYTLVGEHHLRGEIMFSLGRYNEALAWFSATRSSSSLAFNAVRFYYRARCHEALGDDGKANDGYRRFLDLWQHCDPDQHRLVDDAQRRLTALTERG